jgi:hypothetical protein
MDILTVVVIILAKIFSVEDLLINKEVHNEVSE